MLQKCPADKLVVLIERIRIRIMTAETRKHKKNMFFSALVGIHNLHAVSASQRRDDHLERTSGKWKIFFLSKPSPDLINAE